MNESLDLIQKAYACFGRGDIPALLAMMAPDVEWQFHGDHGAPYTGLAIGPAQVGQWFGQVAQCDDIQQFEPREFLAGIDHVTVIGHERTIAKASGRTFESPWIHIWQIRNGRITRFFVMLDSEAAATARAA